MCFSVGLDVKIKLLINRKQISLIYRNGAVVCRSPPAVSAMSTSGMYKTPLSRAESAVNKAGGYKASQIKIEPMEHLR